MHRPNNTAPCATWLGILGNLNAAKSQRLGLAPHKPLMLLALMDLIEVGEFADGWVPYDIRLVQYFRDYWPIVVERRQNQPEIRMPFHALGSDGVWDRFTEEMTRSRTKQTTAHCHLDVGLHACMQTASFRLAARKVLITTYFTLKEQIALAARLGINLPNSVELERIKADKATYKASLKKGRDSRFKSLVVSGYLHTCLLTGYKLTTVDRTLVEAAHIHQHARSGNDDPTNGLALCPNAHWSFDQGLWTAEAKGDDLIIRVAIQQIHESGPDILHLKAFDGRPLQFPKTSILRPEPKHFDWHQRHRFLG